MVWVVLSSVLSPEFIKSFVDKVHFRTTGKHRRECGVASLVSLDPVCKLFHQREDAIQFVLLHIRQCITEFMLDKWWPNISIENLVNEPCVRAWLDEDGYYNYEGLLKYELKYDDSYL